MEPSSGTRIKIIPEDDKESEEEKKKEPMSVKKNILFPTQEGESPENLKVAESPTKKGDSSPTKRGDSSPTKRGDASPAKKSKL